MDYLRIRSAANFLRFESMVGRSSRKPSLVRSIKFTGKSVVNSAHIEDVNNDAFVK